MIFVSGTSGDLRGRLRSRTAVDQTVLAFFQAGNFRTQVLNGLRDPAGRVTGSADKKGNRKDCCRQAQAFFLSDFPLRFRGFFRFFPGLVFPADRFSPFFLFAAAFFFRAAEVCLPFRFLLPAFRFQAFRFGLSCFFYGLRRFFFRRRTAYRFFRYGRGYRFLFVSVGSVHVVVHG